MKKILFCIFAVFLGACSTLHADYYLKAVYDRMAYLEGDSVHPPEAASSELWIGKKQAAVVSRNRVLILDMKKKRIHFVIKARQEYLTVPIDFDPAAYLDEQSQQLLKMHKYTLDVYKQDETETIDNRLCQKYKIKSLTVKDNETIEESQTVTWATTQVPFDLKLYHVLFGCELKWILPGDKFFSELKRVEGIRVKSEIQQFKQQKVATMTKQKIETIVKKKAPKDIYKIPKGYKKIDKVNLIHLHYFLND